MLCVKCMGIKIIFEIEIVIIIIGEIGKTIAFYN